MTIPEEIIMKLHENTERLSEKQRELIKNIRKMSKKQLSPNMSLNNSRNFKSGSLSLFDVNKPFQSKYFGYDCKYDENEEIKPIR